MGDRVNTLGLAIIVRDEEKTLPRLLFSVKGAFDQVVVADTGSKDRTRDVAKQWGCEVYDFKDPASFDEEGRLCDFSAARNFSFSKIKTEWVMWMDSVTGETPVLVRRVGGNFIEYIEIRDLMPPSQIEAKQLDYARSDYEVMTHQGWKLIRKIKQHRVRKPVLRIVDDGDVRVTRDHSLMSGGKMIAGGDVRIGDHLDHFLGQTGAPEAESITVFLAEAWGFFAAEGWASDITKAGGRGLWALYNTDKELLERLKPAFEGAHARPFRYVLNTQGSKERAPCWRLEPQDPREIAVLYREKFYSLGGRKKVPKEVLNGTKAIKEAFIRGYEYGDGHVRRIAGDGRSLQSWSTNSPLLAAGLFYLYRSVGRDLKCNAPRPDKPTIVSCNERSNGPTRRSKITLDTAKEIQRLRSNGLTAGAISKKVEVDLSNVYKIIHQKMKFYADTDMVESGKVPNHSVRAISEDAAFDGWVYDLNTEAGTFVGGVGDFVLHNSDDVLKPEDLGKLLELKGKLGKADAYLMWYDYAHDEYGKPTVFFRRHRIMRMSKGPRWQEIIHEHLNVSSWASQLETDIRITHQRTAEASAQDKGRNIRLLERAVKRDPGNPRLKFYYGKELYFEGRQDEMIGVLEDFIKGGGCHEDVITAFYWIAMGHLGTKREEQAIDTCLRGIRGDPRWAEFYCMIGNVYFSRRDWNRAIPWYELAAKCPIPVTWGTVQPENYTWAPRDRLCQCHANIGQIDKAFQWNEEFLIHRPSDSHGLFNREFLRDQMFDRLSPRPVRLNLGAGGKPTSGWRNCDLYPAPGVELRIDQAKLPYRDRTVHAIRSEHALEHSDSHYTAEGALVEWARALRHGGHLKLMVPDFEECARKFLATSFRPRSPGEQYTEQEWYKYTIYGIQKSQGSEPPEGQYHRTGFTQPQLEHLLESNGFEITRALKYDGWGTPSLEVEAIQVRNPVRVAWLLHGIDHSDPSMRIRRLNVHRWISRQGMDSILVAPYKTLNGKPQDEGALLAKLRDFDVAIFSSFGAYERKVMEKLILSGVSVISDYNEDLADGHPELAACLEASSVIVCCSEKLAEKASRYGRTLVIPDAYETRVSLRLKVFAFDVDETLEISGGPVKLQELSELMQDGHKVGICGNWAAFLAKAPHLTKALSFCGPHEIPKEDFLKAVRDAHPADEHIMVGNIKGVSGSSDDLGAAKRSGWKFIQEFEFSKGDREGRLA